MPEHKTLTFPPKSEWPPFSAVDWASVNRRYVFLKFRRRLISMFTTLDFVVGNDHYGGEWALLGDPAVRKAHKTYPPPTSAPRRRVHRQTQLFLHRILLDIFSDHCPAIIPITSRPASMMMMICKMMMATLTASVQPFFRPSNAAVCPLMKRRR